MSWVDKKYINLLSSQLENFHWKSENLANSRCPICGDSKHNKKKARFYFYEKDDGFVVHCHNCGYSSSLSFFLKQKNENLFRQYKFERFGALNKTQEKKVEEPSVFTVDPGNLKLLQKVSSLPENHTCSLFVRERKIPNDVVLYYTSGYMAWVNYTLPGKFDKDALRRDEPRLVIPHLFDGKIHACAGRSLGSKPEVKYLLTVFDETIPSVWGLDRVDFNRWVPVTEGPIDAMFLDNAMATNGGNLISKLGTFPKERLVLVFDNEPFNKTTKDKMLKAIDNDFSLVVWPKSVEEKDANDMILAGRTKGELQEIISQNRFHGLQAKLAVTNWSKV